MGEKGFLSLETPPGSQCRERFDSAIEPINKFETLLIKPSPLTTTSFQSCNHL